MLPEPASVLDATGLRDHSEKACGRRKRQLFLGRYSVYLKQEGFLRLSTPLSKSVNSLGSVDQMVGFPFRGQGSRYWVSINGWAKRHPFLPLLSTNALGYGSEYIRFAFYWNKIEDFKGEIK